MRRVTCKSSTRHTQMCHDTSYLSLLNNLFYSGNSGSGKVLLNHFMPNNTYVIPRFMEGIFKVIIPVPSLKIIPFTSCQINENVYNQKTKEGNLYSNIFGFLVINNQIINNFNQIINNQIIFWLLNNFIVKKCFLFK